MNYIIKTLAFVALIYLYEAVWELLSRNRLDIEHGRANCQDIKKFKRLAKFLWILLFAVAVNLLVRLVMKLLPLL